MVLASTATLVAQQPKPSAAAKPEAKAARGPAPRVFGTPLRMHQNFASCVAWSPDGKLAASGGWDGVVQLFDAASGKAVGRLEPGEVVQSVAFCGTGATKLVVKCMKQGLRVYDVATRREVGRLDGELGRIAVFPDGLTVAVGTRAGELWLVDGDTCAKRKAVAVCEGSIETVSVAPDGGMVACNELMSRTGHLYDVRVDKVVKSVKWGSLAPEQLFEPDGKAMLVISSRIVRRITVPGGEEVDSWQLGSTTMCATLSRDGTRLYLGDDEGAVVCIDREAGKVVAMKREHVDAVKDLELSPDGKVLLSASQDRTVRFWAASDLAEQHLAAAHNGLVRSVSLAADGATLVSASNDNSAVVW